MKVSDAISCDILLAIVDFTYLYIHLIFTHISLNTDYNGFVLVAGDVIKHQ